MGRREEREPGQGRGGARPGESRVEGWTWPVDRDQVSKQGLPQILVSCLGGFFRTLVHTHTNTQKNTRVHTYRHTDMNMSAYTKIIYIYAHAYVCTFTCMYTHACIHVQHIYTHRCAHRYTLMSYMHIHSYKCTDTRLELLLSGKALTCLASVKPWVPFPALQTNPVYMYVPATYMCVHTGLCVYGCVYP